MLKFLWNLLVVGFRKQCKHDFSDWEIIFEGVSANGRHYVCHQKRHCQKCNLTQVKRDMA